MATPASPAFSFPVPSFDGSPGRPFNTFIRHFELFAATQKWEEQDRLRFLPLCLEGSAREAYLSSNFPADVTYDTVTSTLSRAFPPPDPIDAQARLRRLRYELGSPLDLFLVTLRGVVRAAYPNTPTEDVLFGALLNSLPENLYDAVIASGATDYEGAVMKLRNLFRASRPAPPLTSSGGADAVHAVGAAAPSPASNHALQQILDRLQALEARVAEPARRPPVAHASPPSAERRQCFCCGRSGHVRANCRLREVGCHQCGQLGHVRRMCQSRNQGNEQGDPSLGTRGPVPESR